MRNKSINEYLLVWGFQCKQLEIQCLVCNRHCGNVATDISSSTLFPEKERACNNYRWALSIRTCHRVLPGNHNYTCLAPQGRICHETPPAEHCLAELKATKATFINVVQILTKTTKKDTIQFENIWTAGR